MRDGLVSIIIPVYNGEQYIDRCMGCIKRQTYRDFEVILVNDGSTDSSMDMCKKYTEEGGVHLISQRNMGSGAARNTGLRNAKGSYIYFMDVDDLLAEDALRRLVTICETQKADFVFGNYKRIELFGGKETTASPRNSHMYKDREEIKELVCRFAEDMKGEKLLPKVWGNLYRSEIIRKNNILFRESMVAWEDIAFTLAYIGCCRNAYYVSDCLYTYVRFGQEGATSKAYKGSFDFKHVISEIKKLLYEDKYNAVIADCYSEYVIWQIFTTVRLLKTNSVNDLRQLYRIVSLLVRDQETQENINYYVQKHDDNSRMIPYYIKKRWIWLIIITFKRQVKRLERNIR